MLREHSVLSSAQLCDTIITPPDAKVKPFLRNFWKIFEKIFGKVRIRSESVAGAGLRG
uniref:Uncharacterized protein n=1 Tax=Podoviridae sp. ctiJY10 TaxID=2826572 RepID=A0A8S5N487_9CAUD|nr:MAG TPA: hypothetical protein [Podoviridae sp. ctiJY10]